jgi:hypothetical protein
VRRAARFRVSEKKRLPQSLMRGMPAAAKLFPTARHGTLSKEAIIANRIVAADDREKLIDFVFTDFFLSRKSVGKQNTNFLLTHLAIGVKNVLIISLFILNDMRNCWKFHCRLLLFEMFEMPQNPYSINFQIVRKSVSAFGGGLLCILDAPVASGFPCLQSSAKVGRIHVSHWRRRPGRFLPHLARPAFVDYFARNVYASGQWLVASGQ